MCDGCQAPITFHLVSTPAKSSHPRYVGTPILAVSLLGGPDLRITLEGDGAGAGLLLARVERAAAEALDAHAAAAHRVDAVAVDVEQFESFGARGVSTRHVTLVYRTVPKWTEARVVQKWSETVPEKHTSGTLSVHFIRRRDRQTDRLCCTPRMGGAPGVFLAYPGTRCLCAMS